MLPKDDLWPPTTACYTGLQTVCYSMPQIRCHMFIAQTLLRSSSCCKNCQVSGELSTRRHSCYSWAQRLNNQMLPSNMKMPLLMLLALWLSQSAPAKKSVATMCLRWVFDFVQRIDYPDHDQNNRHRLHDW